MIKKIRFIAAILFAAVTVGIAAPQASAVSTPDWWTTAPSFWICVESVPYSQQGTFITVKFMRENGTTYLDNIYPGECTDDQTWNKPISFTVPNHETCVSQFGGRYVGLKSFGTSLLKNGFHLECYKW